MQLFHGTIHSLSTEIENSGTIAHLVARPFYEGEDVSTTDGFVYLTDNIGYAIYLAQRNAVYKGEDMCAVYSVDVNYSELLADIDQLRMKHGMTVDDAKKLTATQSLQISQSCAIARSLAIGVDVKAKLLLPSGSNSQHQDYKFMAQLRQLRKTGDAGQALSLVKADNWHHF